MNRSSKIEIQSAPWRPKTELSLPVLKRIPSVYTRNPDDLVMARHNLLFRRYASSLDPNLSVWNL